MKRSILVLAIFLFGLAGCSTHYYNTQGNRLNIYLTVPDAQTVYFASSIDGFTPHKAKRVRSKTWKIEVNYSSEFRYFYIVDGSVYLPRCRLTEKDDFGSENCIFMP